MSIQVRSLTCENGMDPSRYIYAAQFQQHLYYTIIIIILLLQY